MPNNGCSHRLQTRSQRYVHEVQHIE